MVIDIVVLFFIEFFLFIKIIVYKCDNTLMWKFMFFQAKGWTKESQVEFQKLVGSSALNMRVLGQDKDSLLVNLMKIPVDQSCDTPLSVRHYLVFIDVARYLSQTF